MQQNNGLKLQVAVEIHVPEWDAETTEYHMDTLSRVETYVLEAVRFGLIDFEIAQDIVDQYSLFEDADVELTKTVTGMVVASVTLIGSLSA